jgi:hypothetical protein
MGGPQRGIFFVVVDALYHWEDHVPEVYDFLRLDPVPHPLGEILSQRGRLVATHIGSGFLGREQFGVILNEFVGRCLLDGLGQLLDCVL